MLHRTRLAVGLGASVLTVALAGCSVDTGSSRAAAAADPTDSRSTSRATPTGSISESTSPSPTLSGSVSGSISGSPVTSTSPAAPAARRTPADRLLTADEVPGLAGHGWAVSATRRSEGAQPFATCQKFAMTSIGAMRVVVRQYRPAGGPDTDSASHLVADFPDEQTARRAHEVLKSWRGTCEEELDGYDNRDVGALQSVKAAGADAGWYLLAYGPVEGHTARGAWLDAQGLSRVGRRVSLLQLRTLDRADRGARLQSPMVEAVRTASTKLS